MTEALDTGSIPPRRELKFLVPEWMVDQIREMITPWCEPDPHCRKTDSRYSIVSLYLDSPTLDLHRAGVAGARRCTKIRLRGYPGETKRCFAEVKQKDGDLVTKVRAPIPEIGLIRSLLEEPRKHGLGMFARECWRHAARPVLLLAYEREAYQSKAGVYARITFDRRIRFQPRCEWTLDGRVKGWHAVETKTRCRGDVPRVVMELKFSEVPPPWMSATVRQFELRPLRFSKYCSIPIRAIDEAA